MRGLCKWEIYPKMAESQKNNNIFFKTGAFCRVVLRPRESPPHARRSDRRPFARAAGIRAVGGKLPGQERTGEKSNPDDLKWGRVTNRTARILGNAIVTSAIAALGGSSNGLRDGERRIRCRVPFRDLPVRRNLPSGPLHDQPWPRVQSPFHHHSDRQDFCVTAGTPETETHCPLAVRRVFLSAALPLATGRERLAPCNRQPQSYLLTISTSPGTVLRRQSRCIADWPPILARSGCGRRRG